MKVGPSLPRMLTWGTAGKYNNRKERKFTKTLDIPEEGIRLSDMLDVEIKYYLTRFCLNTFLPQCLLFAFTLRKGFYFPLCFNEN